MSILLSRTSAVLGASIGLSFTLSPLSPFRASPMQCQYTAPYHRTGDNNTSTAAETGWGIPADDPVLLKQGRTRPDSSATGSGILNASTMRQVSLGSVLGLVAGVGLRAFSRVLVVMLGMGIVFVEVCDYIHGLVWLIGVSCLLTMFSGLLRKDITSSLSTACRDM